VVRGGGRAKVLTCPYHAWSYHADGRLRTARGSEAVPGFDKEAFCLKPVRVERFLDFYFVNLDADARPMAETYPGLAEEITDHVPFLGELAYEGPDAPTSPPPADLKANWKVLAENCMECYHCVPAHPAFVDLVDIKSYRIACHGTWISSLSRAGNPDNKAYRFGRNDPSQRADFWYLWPNTTLNVLPGEAQMATFRFEPVEAETTRTILEVLRKPGTPVNEERRAYGANVLWPEDKGICEAVQRGLHSRGYGRGRFIVDRDMTEISEHGVHQTQILWARAMGWPITG
jgi:choline monooxygenase